MNENEQKIENMRLKYQIIFGILTILSITCGFGFFTFFFVVGFLFFA